MRLGSLEEWRSPRPLSEEFQILSLPDCGDEWLLRRVLNKAGQDSPGFRPARWVDIVAFTGAPSHDPRGVFLARSRGRYVGCCIGRCRTNGLGYVYSLAVFPEFRRRGAASALLEATLQYLRERGAREARLYVHPENDGARELYCREGFRTITQAADAAR